MRYRTMKKSSEKNQSADKGKRSKVAEIAQKLEASSADRVCLHFPRLPPFEISRNEMTHQGNPNTIQDVGSQKLDEGVGRWASNKYFNRTRA